MATVKTNIHTGNFDEFFNAQEKAYINNDDPVSAVNSVLIKRDLEDSYTAQELKEEVMRDLDGNGESVSFLSKDSEYFVPHYISDERKRIKDQLMPLPLTSIERNISGNLSLGTPTSSESENFV